MLPAFDNQFNIMSKFNIKHLKREFNELKQLANETKAALRTIRSTSNVVAKNGLSYKSGEAIVNGGQKFYKQTKNIRNRGKKYYGHIKKAHAYGRPPPKRFGPNAVQKGFQVTRNNLMRSRGMPTSVRPTKVTNTKTGCTLEHTEMIEPIYATDGQIQPRAIPIAPAQTAFSPFAANLCRQYTKVKCIKMRIFYQGSCGTSQNGKIWMGCDFRTNTFDIDPYYDSTAFAQLDNKPGQDGGCPVWGSCVFNIDIAKFSKGTDRTLTNYSGDITSTTDDVEQYIGGYLLLGCDAPSSGVMGIVWVSYIIELFEARLPAPISDFYSLSGSLSQDSDNLGSILDNSTNISNSNLTSLKTVEDVGVCFTNNTSMTIVVELRLAGTGFQTTGNETDLVYTIEVSDGSSATLYNWVGTATQQVVTWYLKLIDQSFFYYVNSSQPGLVVNTAQTGIYLTAVNIGTSQNVTLPLPSSRISAPLPPHLISKALSYLSKTGEKMQLTHPAGNKIASRRDHYYFDFGNDEAKICDKEFYESKTSSDVDNHEDGEDQRPRLQRGWQPPELTHRGMHAKNGNILYLLLALISILTTNAQQWPFKTTTRHPTPPPTTKRPTTTKPPTLNPTTKPPTTKQPTSAPTDYISYFSMIMFSEDEGDTFGNYIELSPRPLVEKAETSSTIRYNGVYGAPVNLTFALFSTGVLSGDLTLGKDGVAVLPGTNSVEATLQNSLLFGTVSDLTIAQRNIYLTLAPSMVPTPAPQAWMYISVVGQYPVIDELRDVNNSKLAYVN